MAESGFQHFPHSEKASEGFNPYEAGKLLPPVAAIVFSKLASEPEVVGVASEHPDVLSDPGPAALFLGFGESSLDFQLRAWTRGDYIRISSDLLVGVNDALVDAGIEPGPWVGHALKQTRDAIVDGEINEDQSLEHALTAAEKNREDDAR